MLQKEKENNYRLIVENMSGASAFLKVIEGEYGNPEDFIFLEINSGFDDMLDMSRDNIVGKKVTEVMTEIEPAIDWFKTYKKAAFEGEVIECYFQSTEKWYEVAASNLEKGYFFVFFREINDTSEEICRHKKLSYLYNLQLVIKEKCSLEGIIKDAVELLPSAFQSPEHTCARIKMENLEQLTENFRSTPWKITSGIKIQGKQAGHIEVCYLHKPSHGKLPFSKEEKIMLDIIAQHLGGFLEYKHLKEELKYSEQRYRSLVESANEAIFVAQNERIKYANSKTEELLGYINHELLSRSFTSFIHPEDRKMVKERHWKRMKGASPERRYSFRLITKEGITRWVEVSSVLIDWEDNPATLNFLTDISEHKQAEESLQEYQQMLQSTIDSLDANICVLNENGEIILYNRSWLNFAVENGGSLHKVEKGINYLKVCDASVGEDQPLALKFVEGIRAVMKGEKERFELEYPCHSPDHKRWFVGRVTPYLTPAHRLRKVVIAHQNITELKRSEEQLNYLSLHDQLTGLYNRTFFEKEMRRLDNSYPTTVIIADLDGLKLVNDTMGHQKGDELLKTCARVISKSLRSQDVLARVGGDEFAILLPATDEKTGEKILKQILYNVDLHNKDNHKLPLSLSMGLATVSYEKDSLEEVYKKADDLMCRNKLHKSTGIRAQITRNWTAT